MPSSSVNYYFRQLVDANSKFETLDWDGWMELADRFFEEEYSTNGEMHILCKSFIQSYCQVDPDLSESAALQESLQKWDYMVAECEDFNKECIRRLNFKCDNKKGKHPYHRQYQLMMFLRKTKGLM